MSWREWTFRWNIKKTYSDTWFYLEKTEGNSFFELDEIGNELGNMLKEKSCAER